MDFFHRPPNPTPIGNFALKIVSQFIVPILHAIQFSTQFDYVLFTGDIPAHDVWNQSRSDQLKHLHILDGLFQTYLPGVPVYWTVGNHEAAPCNRYSRNCLNGHLFQPVTCSNSQFSLSSYLAVMCRFDCTCKI